MGSPKSKDRDQVAPGPSLKLLAQQLVDDSRAFYEAEKELLKKRLGWRAHALRTLSLFALAATFLAFFGLFFLLMLLVAVLVPHLGWIGAIALVALLVIALALLCALGARKAFKKLVEPEP